MNFRKFSTALMTMALCAPGLASSSSQQGIPGTQASTIDIKDHDQKSTIDCKGNGVTISGDDNRITLEGECSGLTVSGDDNTITAKSVTEIVVSGDDNKINVDTVARVNTSGDDNKIRWKSGLGGRPPEISNTGHDNKAEQDK